MGIFLIFGTCLFGLGEGKGRGAAFAGAGTSDTISDGHHYGDAIKTARIIE